MYAEKKILFDQYVDAHTRLRKNYFTDEGELISDPKLSNDEVKELAKTSRNSYRENQQIYDEFNYYQDTGKVLGVHHVFRTYKLKEAAKRMTELKAYKRAELVNSYIKREERKLKKIQDPEKQKKFKIKIEEFKEELEILITTHNLDV